MGPTGSAPRWLREDLACISSKAGRKMKIPLHWTLYHQSHWVENLFGKLEVGAVSILAITAALTPFCSLSVPPRPSSSGSINET